MNSILINKVKKQLIVLFLLSCTISRGATLSVDTIAHWQIYYGKVVLIQGNASQTSTETREIKIKKDHVWKLAISFNYDTKGDGESELEIRMAGKTIRVLKSVIKEGDFFIVPTKDLIDTKTKGKKYELDFYYSDKRYTKNRKLGTIVFVT